MLSRCTFLYISSVDDALKVYCYVVVAVKYMSSSAMGDKTSDSLKYFTLIAYTSTVGQHPDTRQLTATLALQWLQKAFEGIDAKKASCLLAAGLNLAVAAYVGHKFYKSWTVQWESQRNLKTGASRLWQLATQVNSHILPSKTLPR